MKIKLNCSLADYTTLKLGGMCNKLYFPETKEELTELLSKEPDCKILSGGSNLLINDQSVFENVACLREYEKDNIVFQEDMVTVSSGVRLQKLITVINEKGLGGIEYLYSVPGLVGGAIYMNAGRGRGANKQISDYLISVDVLENGRIKTMTREQCGFDYRTSVFQGNQAVILQARFRFDRINPEEGKRLQYERINICKTFQDNLYPNAGTTFCKSDPKVMGMFQKISNSKTKKGVHFSKKVPNWLQNRGDGTFREAKKLIERVQLVHKLLGKQCKLEYKVWE